MAERGDPKGWVEGLEDGEDDEARMERKNFQDTVRKVMQQQTAMQVYDDHGPIVNMPKVSKKWSTLIDDTIVGVQSASVKRMRMSVNPENEDRPRRGRSVPAAFSVETLDRAFPPRGQERPPSPRDVRQRENPSPLSSLSMTPPPNGSYTIPPRGQENPSPYSSSSLSMTPPDGSYTVPPRGQEHPPSPRDVRQRENPSPYSSSSLSVTPSTDYDLPMSPPPPYVEDEEALSYLPLATGGSDQLEKNLNRPKRKDLYRDTDVPRGEVELIQVAPMATRLQMRPRRIPYEEEAPVDLGPTRPVYSETELGAAVSSSFHPDIEYKFPQVLPDTEIDELPPGVEVKSPPRRALPVSSFERTDGPARDVESARTRESETYECNSCGGCNPLVTRIGRFCLRWKEGISDMSGPRLLILIGAIVGILGVIVFLGVFPNSFVYVEHYEIALLKNTFTGTVYRDTTYHPGCYVLGPEREFLKFPGSAVFVSLTEAVFTRDKLEITITFNLQYFIRPSELGELHRKFGVDYKEFIESVIRSRVKNSATDISVDEFRFNRTHLETKFFNIIKSRLQGTCCPDCCPSCTNRTVCNVCDTSTMCNPIYHVDVRYFQLSTVTIAKDVSERYLTSLLLKVTAETEFFKQNHTVIERQTEQMVEHRKNEANEMIRAGEATAAATMLVAEAQREANITTGYAVALWTMYNRLGITDMEHKLSLMMVRALEDISVKGNLYRGYNYGNRSLVSVGAG